MSSALISVMVHRTRKFRKCDSCKKDIAPGNPYVRSFLHGDVWDKPTEYWMHPECVEDGLEPISPENRRIIEAIREAREKGIIPPIPDLEEMLSEITPVRKAGD